MHMEEHGLDLKLKWAISTPSPHVYTGNPADTPAQQLWEGSRTLLNTSAEAETTGAQLGIRVAQKCGSKKENRYSSSDSSS